MAYSFNYCIDVIAIVWTYQRLLGVLSIIVHCVPSEDVARVWQRNESSMHYQQLKLKYHCINFQKNGCGFLIVWWKFMTSRVKSMYITCWLVYLCVGHILEMVCVLLLHRNDIQKLFQQYSSISSATLQVSLPNLCYQQSNVAKSGAFGKFPFLDLIWGG